MKGTPEDKVETAEVEFSKEKTLALNRDEPGSLQDLLRLAVDKGTGVEALEKLFALYERDADRRAAQEFNDAMARFQDECPPIPKTTTAEIRGPGGALKYSYNYPELDQIARTIGPHLHKNGFNYSWDEVVTEDMLTATCTLAHVNGHSRQASFTGPTTSDNPGQSLLQKNASTLTFARRQALVMVLGLTTTDPDADGASVETISKEQAETLQSIIRDVKPDMPRFWAYMGVADLDSILATDYAKATVALERKRQDAKKSEAAK